MRSEISLRMSNNGWYISSLMMEDNNEYKAVNDIIVTIEHQAASIHQLRV